MSAGISVIFNSLHCAAALFTCLRHHMAQTQTVGIAIRESSTRQSEVPSFKMSTGLSLTATSHSQ